MKSNSITAFHQQDEGQVDQAMGWLLRLPQLPPAELPPMADVEATVAALTKPVAPMWCMARIASLLSPYYEKETPQSVREMEAEDWMEALAQYPQWAVDRAVRWWKGAENPDRRKRPMEGDIAARCKVEMRGIHAMPALLTRRVRAEEERRAVAPRPEPTPEEIAARRAISEEVMAHFGKRHRA